MQELTTYQAAYTAEETRARAALACVPQIRNAELLATAGHMTQVCANALFVFPVSLVAFFLLMASGWSLDASMQMLHQVYFAKPIEQQQELLKDVATAWAFLAISFTAFDMLVRDMVMQPRLTPLDRAVALNMRQWEGRHIAALLQSASEDAHAQPGESS